MKILRSNENGVTLRDLRNAMQGMIDIDENGTDAMLYAAVGNLHVSAVTAIAKDEDGDLILISAAAEGLMKDLGSWDDFIRD
jgi:hypothetical protein